MIRFVRTLIYGACASAMLVACGGNDLPPSAVMNPTLSTGPAALTASNATAAAGVAARITLGEGVFGRLRDVRLPDIPGGTGVLVPVASKFAQPSLLFSAVSGSFDCAVAGTVAFDVSVADPFNPAVDDRYGLEFMACNDGDGTVVNGSMIITITALDGDFSTDEFLLGMSLELSAFQVTQAGQTTGASGLVSVEIDKMTPPLTTITVSTSALATSSQGTAEAVTNMSVTVSEDSSMFPAAVSVDTSFTVSSPDIGGEVSVATSLSLQSTGAEYPYAGELRITGAGNSVVVLIALDSIRVRLEIDVDGDGATDDTIETTWAEILAAAG